MEKKRIIGLAVLAIGAIIILKVLPKILILATNTIFMVVFLAALGLGVYYLAKMFGLIK